MDVGERLCQRVNLVVVAAVGERGRFVDQVVGPALPGGEPHVAGLDERGDGSGADFLAALGLHGDQAGDAAREQVDHGGPVGLVLDERGGGLRPPLTHHLDLADSLDEGPASAGLVEQVHVRAVDCPHLADDKVGVIGALEGHVPRLDDAVRECGRLVPAFPPGALESATFGGCRAALIEGVPGPGADADLDLLPVVVTHRATCAGRVLRVSFTPSRLEVLSRLAAQRVGFPLRWMVVGLGGDVDDPPAVSILGCQ